MLSIRHLMKLSRVTALLRRNATFSAWNNIMMKRDVAMPVRSDTKSVSCNLSPLLLAAGAPLVHSDLASRFSK